MPRAEVSQWPAHGHHRATYQSPCRSRWQRVHELPHAQDRAGDRERERPQPYLQIHRPGGRRALEDAQFVQYLSHRRDGGVGQQSAQDLARILPLAHRELGTNAAYGDAKIIYPGSIDRQFIPGYIISMSYIAFQGHTRIAAGNLTEVSSLLKDKVQGDFLVFDDAGRQIDLDV